MTAYAKESDGRVHVRGTTGPYPPKFKMSKPRRPSKNEKLLVADGWRLVHTNPAYQSFHFERFVGQRRVATYVVNEKTTPRAWTRLKRAYERDTRKGKT